MVPLKVYKASAGSGKTFTLAVEYVTLLVLYSGEKEFTHILAVTFTNKATTEMKDRIIAHLYGVGGTDHVLSSSRGFFDALKQNLSETHGFHASDEEIRRRCALALQQILHDYSHFRVQTIDAFFQTILRGLAHELGLTANLQVEISDTEVLSEAVDRIIDRLKDEPEVQSWLFSLVQEQIENNQRWDVTREVKDFGRAIFNETYLRQGDQLRRFLSDRTRLNEFISELSRQRDDAVATLRQYARDLAEALRQGGVNSIDFSNGKTLENFIQKLQKGEMNVKLGTRIEGWADDPLTMVKTADRNARQNLIEVADVVSGILTEVREQLPHLRHQHNSARLALRHIKPLLLLDFIDREVTEINSETSRFNLAKTPIFLNRMVGQDDAPFIFEKIGALLHHIMIDEFQDTSRLQWENFRVLLLDTFARGGHNLLVGDVKQSIYRWRGGDWRMLGYIDREIQPKPDVKPLKFNFRSATRVIRFNNRFFCESTTLLDDLSVADETLLGMEWEPIPDDPEGRQRGFFGKAYADVCQKPKPGRAEGGRVMLTVLDTGQEPFKKREGWQAWILEDLRARVSALHAEGIPYEQMTILIRNNSDAAPIIEAFAADASMPPIVSDEAFMFSSSQTVRLLIAALRHIDDPEEPVSVEMLKRCPCLPEGLWTNPTLREMPLAGLLEHLYVELGLSQIPGQDAFLFGFFDAVSDYLRDGQADVHSFLNYWDDTLSRKSIPAGRADGIRILSIHKSKGLQFHTVLIPFCAWDFERDRLGSLLWCHPTEAPYSELGILPISPSSATARESVFAVDYTEEHLHARLDELNALYVAFTRAEENLVVWAPGGNLERDGRTVGDLVANVMPRLADLHHDILAESRAEGVMTYKVSEEANPSETDVNGGPDASLTPAQPDDEPNRMEPEEQLLPVRMVSHTGVHQFRQSNQSSKFVRQLAIDQVKADDDEAEIALLLEQNRQQEYIDTGLLLHNVFQQITTRDDIGRVLESFESDGLLTGTVSVAALSRRIERAMNNPQIAKWFDGSFEVIAESSILSIDPATHIPVTLRPDRVMRSADGREVVVVDFKFGTCHEGYDEQVQRYMRLMREMYPTATVSGFLWFVNQSKVKEVHDERF